MGKRLHLLLLLLLPFGHMMAVKINSLAPVDRSPNSFYRMLLVFLTMDAALKPQEERGGFRNDSVHTARNTNPLVCNKTRPAVFWPSIYLHVLMSIVSLSLCVLSVGIGLIRKTLSVDFDLPLVL